MRKRKKVSAISLFSGCGGLDVGCYLAGIPVAVGVEIDKDCVATLKANKVFGNAKILNRDIKEVSTKEILKAVKKAKSEKNIVIGGPPCQPFSKASYWVGHGRRKGIEDPRNLINDFFRVVEETKCDGFLMENVESLLHPKHKKMIEIIKKKIKTMGYDHRIIRANALDYGVPQRRKRIFVIGSKRRFKINEPIRTHAPQGAAKPVRLKPYESVGKLIAEYGGEKYKEKEEVAIHGTYGKELQLVPPGKNYIAISRQKGFENSKFEAGKRFWSFLLKLHPNRPSWTIAAQPGPWVGPFHWKNRRLRVPEIAAIQTFPNDYKFVGSRRSIQRQIGNAVPPRMAKAMVEFLLENL